MYHHIIVWIHPILELSVKFESQICHENINKPLDGAYLADFGIVINLTWTMFVPSSILLVILGEHMSAEPCGPGLEKKESI